MTKAELMTYIGKRVFVALKNSKKVIYGRLNYVEEFSDKYSFRKASYFYIGDTSFKVSHVRKLVESDDTE
mgnify:CR=1 FL=1